MNNAVNRKGEGVSSMLIGALRGLVVSIISGFFLVCIIALIVYMMPDPDKYLSIGSLAALYLSALIGGIFAARSSDKGALSGLVSGLLLLALILIISAFDSASGSSFGPLASAFLYIAVPIVSFLSAMFIAARGNIEKRPKFKKRRH